MTDDQYKEARRNVRATRNFYKHLVTYVVVMVVLIIINMIKEPSNLWFLWVGGIWGAILLAQFISRVVINSKMDSNWEKRKIDERLSKSDKDDNPK